MKSTDLPEESSESIVVECELDEPREKVWRALTVPEIVAEWLMPQWHEAVRLQRREPADAGQSVRQQVPQTVLAGSAQTPSPTAPPNGKPALAMKPNASGTAMPACAGQNTPSSDTSGRAGQSAPSDELTASEKQSALAGPITAPGTMHYEVVAAEHARELQYRLREGDGLAIESTVTFELSDTPTGGTHLRIVHDAFELADNTTAQPKTLCAMAEGHSALRPTDAPTSALVSALSPLDSSASPLVSAPSPFDASASPLVMRTHRRPSRARRAMNRRRTRTLCLLRARSLAAA